MTCAASFSLIILALFFKEGTDRLAVFKIKSSNFFRNPYGLEFVRNILLSEELVNR